MRRGRARGRNYLNYYESDIENLGSVSSFEQFSSVSHQPIKVSSCQLVKTLWDLSDPHQATLLTLLEKFKYDHKEVRQVVARCPKTFVIKEELVSLRPQIKICDKHLDKDGCSMPNSCQDLHICFQYIVGACQEEECLFGHIVHTEHNKPIINKLFLNTIPAKGLLILFKTILTASNNLTERLEICSAYNSDMCSAAKCPKVHLCLKLVARCCKTKCKLNHDVFEKQTDRILRSHGVSMNESPKDILNQIAHSNLIKKEIEGMQFSLSAHAKQTTDNDAGLGKSNEQSLKENTTNNLTNKTGVDGASAQIKSLKTTWSSDFNGDVTLDEICYDSVENLCSYEESGCWRLHSNFHFYWQVRPTTGGEKCHWINLTEKQALALEKAFCDPYVDKAPLPALDPSTLPLSSKGLLKTLNGRAQWEANFNRMQLKPVQESKNLTPLHLRRLCTEISSNHPTIPEACIFKWFFRDTNKKWIEYGNTDSTGKEKLKCSITSSDIEKHLKENGEDSIIQFSNQSFTYILDLYNMTQTNLETNATRKVRRRPQSHLNESSSSSSSQGDGDLPVTWEPMQNEEIFRRVVLSQSSQEYQGLLSHIANNGGNGINVVQIERVQNPFLWRAFQNKLKEMLSLYKDSSIVNVRQLFHGTNPDTVSKICQENFDWRLHGTNAGQACGRGTYFSPFASTSHGYARPDATGARYMFIARVAVGTMTGGNSSMSRPPINTQYNVPYDATVNSISNPSIIVKYDKQEYFPEYIITIK